MIQKAHCLYFTARSLGWAGPRRLIGPFRVPGAGAQGLRKSFFLIFIF